MLSQHQTKYLSSCCLYSLFTHLLLPLGPPDRHNPKVGERNKFDRLDTVPKEAVEQYSLGQGGVLYEWVDKSINKTTEGYVSVAIAASFKASNHSYRSLFQGWSEGFSFPTVERWCGCRVFQCLGIGSCPWQIEQIASVESLGGFRRLMSLGDRMQQEKLNYGYRSWIVR